MGGWVAYLLARIACPVLAVTPLDASPVPGAIIIPQGAVERHLVDGVDVRRVGEEAGQEFQAGRVEGEDGVVVVEVFIVACSLLV